MESIKMMHLGIRKGEVGRYVFLPGSPERSEKISKYLENPIEIAYNREFLTFTGTLEGVQVSVTSTGIGGPSTAIAVEELYQCGADTMIRVGTCASVSEDFHKGDLIIPNGAVRMEGAGRHYLPTEFPAVPDFETTRILEEAAIRLNYVYKVGITITKAGFFTQTSPATKPIGPELIQKWAAYRAGGALATSMECAPLFLVGASLGIRAGAVLVSATNDASYSGDVKDYPYGFEHLAIETGIEAMRMMILRDREAGNLQA